MQQNNLKLATEWFSKADEEELVCEIILKQKIGASVLCFHSHQIVEKYLKGFLTFKGRDFEKIHDLIRLVGIVKEFIPEIKNFQKELSLLNRYYIETRYPGDAPEGFSWQEAETAFGVAKQIKNFILDKIK